MGCALVLMFTVFVIIVSAITIAAIVVLGVALGTVLTAIMSTLIYIFLSKNDFFKRYKNSEKMLERYAPGVVRIVLILVMISSWLATAGWVALLVMQG